MKINFNQTFNSDLKDFDKLYAESSSDENEFSAEAICDSFERDARRYKRYLGEDSRVMAL